MSADVCNCGGQVPMTDHRITCPASLYRAGIERGREEMRAAIVAFVRTKISRGSADDEPFMSELARMIEAEGLSPIRQDASKE